MEGGINAWKGLRAEGVPQAGMAYFPPAAKPEELIALAWYLEDGAYKFYSELAEGLQDREANDTFKELSRAEESHKASLLKLYKEISGVAPDQGFPSSVITPGSEGNVMEGGMLVSEALKWTKGKKLTEILELSLSQEANSYDLYVKMERRMKDRRSAQIFQVLSKEEKQHLERLSSFLEKKI
jgi:rubrerythrin